MMPRVCLRLATDKDIGLYKNLFNLYQNELSVYADAFSDVDENGYFDADTVKEIFPPDDSIFPYVITSEDKNIGLILITAPPYAAKDCAWCVQELFLVNRHRGTGEAETAVRLALEKRPGRWCLQAFRDNARAVAFWRRIAFRYGADATVYDVDKRLIGMEFTVKTPSPPRAGG